MDLSSDKREWIKERYCAYRRGGGRFFKNLMITKPNSLSIDNQTRTDYEYARVRNVTNLTLQIS